MADYDDEIELDELIEQITVDAYGDEGYWSFLQALTEDAETPLDATLAGAPIRIRSFDFDGNERRGITTTVDNEHGTHIVSLLDINIDASRGPVAARIVTAYRRWLGAA